MSGHEAYSARSRLLCSPGGYRKKKGAKKLATKNTIMTRTGKEIKVAFIRFEKFGDRGRHKELREKKRIKEKEYRKKNATPFQGKCLSSLALWCRIV